MHGRPEYSGRGRELGSAFIARMRSRKSVGDKETGTAQISFQLDCSPCDHAGCRHNCGNFADIVLCELKSFVYTHLAKYLFLKAPIWNLIHQAYRTSFSRSR